MRVAIAGHGRMGKSVSAMALSRGHTIDIIVDDSDDMRRIKPGVADVAIEFTVPAVAPEVISLFLRNNIPVVSGTTGWLESYDDICRLVQEMGSAFIHAPNFSPGVRMLSGINRLMASLAANIPGYKASVEEVHHKNKLDSPSGTAIMLSEQIIDMNGRYRQWSMNTGKADDPSLLPVVSFREGEVPGRHRVVWESSVDRIEISHEAYGRDGFALGAVMAAEYICNRKGLFNLEDVFGF